MRAVITVTGKDRTGIIAKISNTLYEHQVNIIDISQACREIYANKQHLAQMSSDFPLSVSQRETLAM